MIRGRITEQIYTKCSFCIYLDLLVRKVEIPGFMHAAVGKPGSEVTCSIQLSMYFFLLINIEMPTIVGILIFMSRKIAL